MKTEVFAQIGGLAELFAAHRTHTDGKSPRLRIMQPAMSLQRRLLRETPPTKFTDVRSRNGRVQSNMSLEVPGVGKRRLADTAAMLTAPCFVMHVRDVPLQPGSRHETLAAAVADMSERRTALVSQ